MNYGWQATRRWTANSSSQIQSTVERLVVFPAELAWSAPCDHVVVSTPKRFVYVLKTERQPFRYYTGVTSNVHNRLRTHNAGGCPHTSTGCPWSVDVVVEFCDERRALEFEKYLKSGSGCAFAQRHLR